MTARPGTGPGLFGVLDLSIRRVALWADHLAALVCSFLIAATTSAMIIYQQGIAIAWLDDVLRTLLIWLVYLGSVSLCLDNDHISMDAVYHRLPPPARKAVDLVIALLGIVLCLFVAKIGYDSMSQQIAYGAFLDSGYIPSWPQALAIPLCFGLMTVAYLSYLVAVITGRRRRRISEAEKMAEGV
jgi:TRAP-type C4-dicarboxylate transport system permease small subunit